ncbi:hypothetical protein, partial [uncultured Rikenella sp.]|uniref:hypothetical protein n=1 Tax=uncultured Rikenella sp. TaxID=368003 RepID=UPI00262721D8
MIFSSQIHGPGYSDYRGNGFQLRCLSHPQGVLLAASTLLLFDVGGSDAREERQLSTRSGVLRAS